MGAAGFADERRFSPLNAWGGLKIARSRPLFPVMDLDPRPVRVLFVDDEAPVLDGIRNALRRDRKRWEMIFAVGAEAALVELGATEFDVVISDMRMPGMDGATLLERVRELQPWALRFVLSGHADRPAVVRAHSVAHHFLSKPCEPVVLRGMLERASDLSRRIRSPRLRELVGKVSLPPTPEPIWPVSATDLPPHPSPVSGVLAREPETASRFLRMANTVFGIKSAFQETDRAVAHIGGDVAGAMVLAAQAFAGFHALGAPAERVEQVQNHSLLTAWLASSMLDAPGDARTAFTAGLLHDLGKLVLELVYLGGGGPSERAEGDSEEEQEEDHFGFTHAEVSAYVLGKWGLPLPVVEAVAHHHNPPPVVGSFSVPWAVHLADSLVYEANGRKGDIFSSLQTQRTTVSFMTDLEQRMTTARRQLLGHTEGSSPSANR